MKIVRAIIAGAFIGAALFFMPFFIARTLITVLIIGGFIRLIAKRKFGANGMGEQRLAFANKLRNMSEEEYNNFKSNPRQFFMHGKSCGHCKTKNQ